MGITQKIIVSYSEMFVNKDSSKDSTFKPGKTVLFMGDCLHSGVPALRVA